MRWFRLYEDLLNDPKVQGLAPPLFKAWVNILCLASKGKGIIPPATDVAFGLRCTPAQATSTINKLIAAGLIDLEAGGVLRPHNWDKRQWLSDSSAERVKRHRQKRSDAGLKPQWSCPDALRQQIYARDGFACVYCSSTEDLTIDHKISEMSGGTDDEDNLQTCCRACNASKRDMSHEEFVTRRVTGALLKRPQTTEQNTEAKQTSENPPSPAGSSPPKPRDDFGTRLQTDWLPSPEGRKYAIEQGFFPSDLPKVIDKFRAHFAALPGRKGLSADWSASWVKWVLDEARIQKVKPRVRVEGEQPADSNMFVHFDTEAGKAWIAYYLRVRGRKPMEMWRQGRPGFYFPTEFPPDHKPAAPAPVEA